MRVEILQDRRTNRPNGDGHVFFSTIDAAKEAMKCDRKYMGNKKQTNDFCNEYFAVYR